MTLDEIILDIHALDEDLRTFERKYGVLSATFYESYSKGEEPEKQEWVLDFAEWAGTYKIWLRRQEQYQAAVKNLMKPTQTLAQLIAVTARHEPIAVPG
jgi:hypothetical protein